ISLFRRAALCRDKPRFSPGLGLRTCKEPLGQTSFLRGATIADFAKSLGINLVFDRWHLEMNPAPRGGPNFYRAGKPQPGETSFSTRTSEELPGRNLVLPGKNLVLALENLVLSGTNLVFARKNEVCPNHRRTAHSKDTNECKLLDWQPFHTNNSCAKSLLELALAGFLLKSFKRELT